MSKKNTSYFTCTLLALLSYCMVSTAAEFKGSPYVKMYLPKEYGAGMQNYQLAQDKRGVIYIGNNYGLLIYDGNQWRINGVRNSTKVRSVAVHPSGRVYVGAQSEFGFYEPDERGILNYHSLSMYLDESHRVGEVWNTLIVRDGIYFCTSQDVYFYHEHSVRKIVGNMAINSCFQVGNKIYVDLKTEGLHSLEGKSLVSVPGSEILKDKRVLEMSTLIKGQLIAVTESSGFYIYKDGKYQPWNVACNKILKNKHINAFTVLLSHELAIGTESNGVYIADIEGNIKYHLDKARGFNNKVVSGLMEDNFGNLWVGQDNGLAKIELSSPFTFLAEHYGLEGAGYCGVLDDERLYLGTNHGLFSFQLDELSDRNHLPKAKKHVSGQIYSVSDVNGKLYIGANEGALIINNDEVTALSRTAGAWKFASPRSNPNVLIEGNYFGFKTYQKNQQTFWKEGVQHPDLKESSRVFIEDENGIFWMTHGYKGVYRIDFADDYQSIDSVKYYGIEDGFATNQLINVFDIKNELVFVSGRGIYRYVPEKDRFELHPTFTEIFGPDIHMREMEEDPYGNVYFVAHGLAGVLEKNNVGGYTLNTNIFSRVQNWLNDDLEDITALDFNNVIFGGYEGFIHYNPQKSTRLLEPIQALIRRVYSTNSDSLFFGGDFMENSEIINYQPKTHSPVFSYDQNSIEFDFTATFFGHSDTEYSYYLEGFEDDWSSWTTTSHKEYTNLREGHYKFMVRAKNIYNIVSEPATYSFKVLPPWYRTSYAYFGYFLVVTFIIVGLLQTQSVRHKQEKKELTIKQKRELMQKETEMVQLSKKSNEEIDKLKTEKLQLEINTKNKELASSTMNLIDKNQLLSGLKNDLNTILDKDGKSTGSASLKMMIKKIDKSISQDDEWEHFQHYFDQVHGDFTHRLRDAFSDLTPQEVKLSNYLRMNLSTKEIAQLMNISNRGVEIARYRLRKKLQLSRDVNLTEFIGRF